MNESIRGSVGPRRRAPARPGGPEIGEREREGRVQRSLESTGPVIASLSAGVLRKIRYSRLKNESRVEHTDCKNIPHRGGERTRIPPSETYGTASPGR